MRTFAIGYLIIESLAVIFNWHNAGGSAGHLGGAIFGFAVLKFPPLKEFVIQPFPGRIWHSQKRGPERPVTPL